jgi:hypothetical protein
MVFWPDKGCKNQDTAASSHGNITIDGFFHRTAASTGKFFFIAPPGSGVKKKNLSPQQIKVDLLKQIL